MPENPNVPAHGDSNEASRGSAKDPSRAQPGARPGPPGNGPAARKEDVTRTHATLPESEEPVTTGTVFLTLVFLMMIFGFWMMMYFILLER